MHPRELPYLLYADENGTIYEDPLLHVAGRSGSDIVALRTEDFIELPEGSDLYVLPDRYPIGMNPKTGQPAISKKGFAVSAQMSPAHTMLYMAAYQRNENAKTLPLFAYSCVGWLDGKYYVTAIRIDRDVRQEPLGFDHNQVIASVSQWHTKYPDNRLLQHIGTNCALNYKCPAARNFFLNRWEAPIPTSPACNSNCIGCISFQPEDEHIRSTQNRITFKPTAEEITQYATEHLNTAPYPIVSFGQGCEGEPLLMWPVIQEAIVQIRMQTNKGSININTNGSMPKAVEALCSSGLNSIRVSLNSVREELYNAYYLPNNYRFHALKESLKHVRNSGGWASINYFVFPGITDEIDEYHALRNFIMETDLSMIQWRNFNIDPDWYIERIAKKEFGETIGVMEMMNRIRDEFPHIMFGYFNPPMEKILKHKELFAN
jgi:sulfatase maturation enzyme AslB (radical SAM superfamily)